METATILAIGSVVAAGAGTAVAVQGNRQAAKAAANAQALEMQQYEEQRRQALQDSTAAQAAAMQDTQSAISATVARRAAAGLDPYSGTGRVLIDTTMEDGAADLETIQMNAVRANQQLGYSAQSSANRGQATLANLRNSSTSAIFSGLGSAAQGGGRYLSTTSKGS
jgi:hypothetical protein